MRIRRVMAVAAAMAVLAACGSGDDVDPAEDAASARAAIDAIEEVLREEGFEAAPAEEDDDEDDLEFASEECEQFAEAFPEDDDELPGETASEEKEFERGELDASGGTEETVEAAVAMVDDEEQLDEMFDLFRDDRLPGCMEEALRAQFEGQQQSDDGVAVEVSGLEVEEQELDDVGDETAGITVDATLSAAGFDFPFHIEFALAREGRTAAMLGLSTIGDDSGTLDSGELLSLLIEEASGG